MENAKGKFRIMIELKQKSIVLIVVDKKKCSVIRKMKKINK